MTAIRTAALAALMLTSACSGFSESRLNPLNWFQGAEPAATEFLVRPEDPRMLVAQVTDLTVEAFPGGVIIRATGLPPTQAWWDAELVRIEPWELTEAEADSPAADPSVAYFEFRIFPPLTQRPASTVPSREVEVATSLSDVAMRGIDRIIVQATGNALSSRR